MGAPVAIGAVLCDLDGTLIDSLPALREAYAEFLEAHAADAATAPPFERFNGTPLPDVVLELQRELSLDGGTDALLAQYLAILERGYAPNAVLAPGALALLDDVRARGARTAVVTSAPRALALRVLERCDLLARLDAVVAGDDVADAKPSPLGYLEALRVLGVDAAEAIAIEDSPAGVQAAIAAGVRCIAVAGPGEDRGWIPASGARASSDLAAALELLRGACVTAVPAIPADRCELVVTHRRPRDPALERAVDDAWRTITAAEPQLFDGPLLSVVALHVDGRDVRIETEVVGYRDFVVQRRTPLALGVRPLGVTGVTSAGTRVLLGRRSARVTQYPGLWEPVPAGSVAPGAAPAELERQLLAELGEELGIGRDEVASIALAGVVLDEADDVVDVCFALSVSEAVGQRAVAAHARLDEHAELVLCSREAARALAGDGTSAVPTMAPMLALTLDEPDIG